jgi:hypothetical protein
MSTIEIIVLIYLAGVIRYAIDLYPDRLFIVNYMREIQNENLLTDGQAFSILWIGIFLVLTLWPMLMLERIRKSFNL